MQYVAFWKCLLLRSILCSECYRKNKDIIWLEVSCHHVMILFRDLIACTMCLYIYVWMNVPMYEYEWMKGCLKAHQHTQVIKRHNILHKVVLCHCWRTMTKHDYSISERIKRGRVRAELSDPKRTKGIHIHIHTFPFFYKASMVPRAPWEMPLGAPIAHHKVCPLQGSMYGKEHAKPTWFW